jgi:hypothetical protein
MLKKAIKWLFCCVVLLQFACSNRPDDILSRSEMKSFLTDLHLLEGVFLSDVTISEDDKILYYQALFQKHGISKAQFDSSLVYYTRNPKVFERIYTGVNKNLEGLRAEVEAGKYTPVLPDSIRLKPLEINIWNQDTTFTYPDDSTKNQSGFSLVNSGLLTKDIYSFSFRMRALPHDSVKSGYTTFRIHYADGNVDSLWHKVNNDSVLRRYKFRFNAARNIKIDSLSGVFYASPTRQDTISFVVDSIMLFRKYIPALQDSLRMKLDTIPLINQTVDSIKTEDSIPPIKTVSAIKKEALKKRI